MKPPLIGSTVAFTVAAFASPTLAQGGSGYELTWSTVDGGGVTFAAGDGYAVDGTVGQPDAGRLIGDAYTVTGGFCVFDSEAAPLDPPGVPQVLVCSPAHVQDCQYYDTCVAGLCGMYNNRYLSIVPPAAGPGAELGVKVTVVDGPCVGAVWYAGPAAQYPEKDLTQPLGWFTGAALGPTPAYSDWSVATDGMAHLFGAAVGPETQYDVQTISEDGGESTPLRIQTPKWADIVPPFHEPGNPVLQPNFRDIGAIVDKFKGFNYLKAQAQLHPEVPSPTNAVDFKDISKAVEGFTGTPYPYPCTSQ